MGFMSQGLLVVIIEFKYCGMLHRPLMAIILAVIQLSSSGHSHFIPRVREGPAKVSSYVNQPKEIPIPFKKCFQVDVELATNWRYLNFEPSSLVLNELKRGQISQNTTLSVLEDLRSPSSFTHEHLLVFPNYSLAFVPPRNILIIKQEQDLFRVHKKITISEIGQQTELKLYKFNEKAIMILYGSKGSVKSHGEETEPITFLIDESGYEAIKTPIKNRVAHLEGHGKEFFTVEYSEGVRCYSYSETTKAVSLVASYPVKMFTGHTQSLELVDINIKSLQSHNLIYVLDSREGVFRLNLTESQLEPRVELVVGQSNCNAMDLIAYDHLVLVCQLGSTSYIVEAYAKPNEKGQLVFNKLQPDYHLNYFNDLEVNRNYFLVFSHRALNVYWSSKENDIPETVNTRSHLDLTGLQTFYFRLSSRPNDESYLFLIQSGVMKKMLITESAAKLTVKSSQPVEKSFKVSIFGSCADLPQQTIAQMTGSQGEPLARWEGSTCELQKTLNLEIAQQSSPRKQDFSVSASIIVILIVIFLLVIWICLKKYKGLERQARKVLEAYKKKKRPRI